ncbi:MAG: FapA family protein, partial [Firmicutes bacterium]|nr:FapA family protein [Bacillota bacterium]
GLTATLILGKMIVALNPTLDSLEVGILIPEIEQTLAVEEVNNLDQVYDLLHKIGVDYGIDHGAIKLALLSTNGEETIIAKGLAPQPGEDASFEFFFPKIETHTRDEDSILNIDYRHKGDIPAVDKDILLAKKNPANPGKVGKAVTGDVLYPPPVKDIVLSARKNTYLSENGLEVYSAVLGQPIMVKEQQGYSVSVEPTYILNGDVNITSGHINFRGNIQVNGKVSESMEVFSAKDITILESVTGALVKAKGSVIVKNNVINSKLFAGLSQSYALRAYPKLVRLESTLAEILKSFQQVIKMPSYKNARFGYILDLLVEKKFKNLLPQMEELGICLTINAKYDLDQDTIFSIIALKQQLDDFSRLPYQKIDNAVALLRSTGVVKNKLTLISDAQSNISVLYCQNSTLDASGNIIISGQGCFHTDIISQGNIEIRGVARGGTIKAEKNVKIYRVGSDAAIRTDIIVPTGQIIYIGQVYENTVVTVGKESFRFTVPRRKVKVSTKQGAGIAITNY